MLKSALNPHSAEAAAQPRRGLAIGTRAVRHPCQTRSAGMASSPRCFGSCSALLSAKPQPGTPHNPDAREPAPAAHLPLAVVPELQRAGWKAERHVSHTVPGSLRDACLLSPCTPLCCSHIWSAAGAGTPRPVRVWVPSRVRVQGFEDISKHSMKTPNTCGLKTDFSKAAAGTSLTH